MQINSLLENNLKNNLIDVKTLCENDNVIVIGSVLVFVIGFLYRVMLARTYPPH